MKIFSTVLVAACLFLVPPVTAQNLSATLVHAVAGSIDVPYNAALMAPPNGITVEAWVTYDGSTLGPTPWDYPTIVRGRDTTNWSYFLRVNAGNTNTRVVRWAVRNQGGTVFNVDWSFNPGELLCWTHVAATYDNATSRLYINGVEVASTPVSGLIVDNGGVIGIGHGTNNLTTLNEVWNGQLDDVRIWSYAATQAQIQSNMYTTLSTATGLEGSWHLDGSAVDSSGFGNHGTIIPTVNFGIGALAVIEYETNDPAASLDIDGIAPSPLCNAQATVSVGQMATMNLQSTLVGSPFDVAVTLPEMLVPTSMGAPPTPGGQIINISVFAPSFGFLFGGTLTTPFPGNLSLPLPSPSPLTAAAQMLVLDPTHPDGLVLSAGVDYVVQ